MSSWTALSTVAGQAQAEALAAAAEALMPAPAAIGVLELEDGRGLWEVGLHFSDPPDRAGLALLAHLHGAADFAVSRLEDRDWVAQVQRELSPVVAGRFFLHGPHDADRVPVNAIPLRIEAAMAFGTGHHGTTLGCLQALVRLHRAGIRPRRVGDIGCGTGVLAIAAHRLWRARCIASDIDPVAMATARANMGINGAAGIRVVRAAGIRHADLARSRFDLILANILARPLMRLAPDLAARCAPDGHVVLSGLLTRQEPAVRAVYAGHGLHLREAIRLGEWSTLILRRSG
ncbi:MAG: 50S ribosomal protein L11 methyltransferase [Alphaproteobacteria bacterium]|nr:MAG: 50S ribosomal protein L11 methyltransferase [Alphaproteobacteria bacterium]